MTSHFSMILVEGQNSTSSNVTMSSLELVDFINSQRKPDEPELRHDNFMAKVPKVLGEESALNLKGSYTTTKFTSKGVEWVAGEWMKHNICAGVLA